MSGLARTMLLMGILTGLLMLIGGVVGYLTGLPMTSTLTFALMMAMTLNLLMYFFADRWVLRIYRARVVSEEEAPTLHRIVERLSKKAGIPKPKVAIIPTDVPNAFATGRSPSRSVVAVTKGALDLLSDEELEGVLAHEIGRASCRERVSNCV